jgi:hypothetical protein
VGRRTDRPRCGDGAERYGDAFHRIEASLKDGAKWRVLDLKRADVRTAIANHSGSVLEPYTSPIAVDYR